MTSVKNPVTMRRCAILIGNSAGAEIKHFVFVDLPAGGAVTATDVVGHDFQPGHRVGFGIVAEEKVAHFLIGIGKMRVRFDADQSAKSGAGAIGQGVFVEQIAGGVRRDVVLQCPGIEFLFIMSDWRPRANRCEHLLRPAGSSFRSASNCHRDANSSSWQRHRARPSWR